jgi:hypothetical protein
VNHKQITDRIRKLLRLAESSNPNEAATAAAMAQKLLAKYNLARSDISAEAEKLQASSERKKTRQRLEDWAFLLARVVSRAFDCEYFHRVSSSETVFVGVDPSPEICGWLYHYLYKTLLRLASRHMRGPQCKRLRSTKSKRSARESFLAGAVYIIGARLKEQKRQTPVTPGALVPAVQAAITAALPDLRREKMKKAPVGGMRDGDWLSGMTAASGIPLSKPLREGESHESRRLATH